MKEALSTKIINTHTNTLDYTDVREAIKIVDLEPGQGDLVYLIYGFAPETCATNTSNDNDHRKRNKSSFGGSSTCEWNREHTYPKSLGTPNLGTSGPGADAHMVRACDVQRNSQRGSDRFIAGSGNSGPVDYGWYPGDEWKGDVARMMMYMYLRYGDRCLPDNVGVGNAVTNDTHMIDLFLQWNAEDPVSQYEKKRNDYLENTSNTYGQGNRNPFIDEPYLATLIWGGPEAEDIWEKYLSTPKYNQLSFEISPNPTTGIFYIHGLKDSNLNNGDIQILSLQGNLISKQKYHPENTQIFTPPLTPGIYLIRIHAGKKTGIQKLIIK